MPPDGSFLCPNRRNTEATTCFTMAGQKTTTRPHIDAILSAEGMIRQNPSITSMKLAHLGIKLMTGIGLPLALCKTIPPGCRQRASVDFEFRWVDPCRQRLVGRFSFTFALFALLFSISISHSLAWLSRKLAVQSLRLQWKSRAKSQLRAVEDLQTDRSSTSWLSSQSHAHMHSLSDSFSALPLCCRHLCSRLSLHRICCVLFSQLRHFNKCFDNF
jgi:hypothetical protein